MEATRVVCAEESLGYYEVGSHEEKKRGKLIKMKSDGMIERFEPVWARGLRLAHSIRDLTSLRQAQTPSCSDSDLEHTTAGHGRTGCRVMAVRIAWCRCRRARGGIGRFARQKTRVLQFWRRVGRRPNVRMEVRTEGDGGGLEICADTEGERW
jgi:hypothetical protein